jgi:hypothetical protein
LRFLRRLQATALTMAVRRIGAWSWSRIEAAQGAAARGEDVKIAAASFLAFALTGCAWVGPQAAERGTLQFENGVTTQSEVIAKLGQPNETTWLPNGTVVDVYTFVPAADIPATDGTSRSRVITVTFDSAGKLLSYSNSNS